MAYLLEDEDENAKGVAPGMGSMGGLMGAGAPAATPASSSPVPSQGGSGFVGWDRILNANKDVSQRESDKMAAGLQKQAQDVKSKQGEVQGRFDKSWGSTGTTTPTPASEGPAAGRSGTNQFGQPTGTPKPTVQAAGMPQQSTPPPQQTAQPQPQATPGQGSLSDDSQWGDLLKSGAESDRRVGATQSEGGLEALIRGNAGGTLTRGGGRMDAALQGASGRRRFDELQKQYGGLTAGLKSADSASRVTANTRLGNIKAAEDEKARIAGERKAALETGLGPNATPEDRSAYDGKESYDKYMGTGGLLEGHKLEHTIQDVGKFLNPAYGVADAAGLPSIEDSRTPGYDAQVNAATGSNLNSQAVQLDRQMPGTSEAMQKAVYESLTRAELTALEKMTKPQQHEYLMRRLTEVQAKAKETLKQQGYG